MMRADADVAVYVCVTPVDMRKQATTLALIVEQALKRNIFEPALYGFSNVRRDRIKIVYWQRNGLCKPSAENPQYRLPTEGDALSLASVAWAERRNAQGDWSTHCLGVLVLGQCSACRRSIS